jgi:hypothetical protein
MWSGRFRQPLDPEFEKWQRSFPYDQRLLPFELAASRAHANALEHADVLSSEELSDIVQALAEIGRRAASSPEFLNDPEAEDVHHFVEKQLATLIGATGYKLHTGRSRNEQIATDLRLFVRASIDTLQTQLADWIEAILTRAESAGSAAMPAYTHLQPAEPVLVSHWLLAYVEMFFRDASRLADCRKRANLCPLGSGAVAGATLTLSRQAMATELGFDGPTANSVDATSDRDFAIEFADALAMLVLHLSRWAEEMILFSTSAYGFVELPEAYSTGSSAMPQKKNPDLLELVRGKAARVMGCATTLQTSGEGSSTRLQQRHAGNAGAALQRGRHRRQPAAAGHRIHEHRRVQRPRDEPGSADRIHERMGRRSLSGRARSSFAAGSRGGWQSRGPCYRTRVRSAKAASRRFAGHPSELRRSLPLQPWTRRGAGAARRPRRHGASPREARLAERS